MSVSLSKEIFPSKESFGDSGVSGSGRKVPHHVPDLVWAVAGTEL